MEIRLIERDGIDAAIDLVTPHFFSQDRAEVERMFEGHAEGNSSTLIGFVDGDPDPVGILTLRWECRYPPFAAAGIPFVHNIEIRWELRGRGHGDTLMGHAERLVASRGKNRIGICVGLFDAYGPAQKLYARRGYIPDGRGACRGHTPLTLGDQVTIDHDLLLFLVKDLA